MWGSFARDNLHSVFYIRLKQVFSPDVATFNVIKSINKLRRIMRKPTFCLCENKDADQLRLCFHYINTF